jgi:hypothetical protein
MNRLGGELLKNPLQAFESKDRLGFRETSQAHRTGADLLLDFLKLTTGTKSAHRVDEWIELCEEKGAKIIVFSKQAFGAALSGWDIRGKRRGLMKDLAELL